MATSRTRETEPAWRERVSAYSMDDSSAEERVAVEAHLATCAPCCEALAAYIRFDALARSPLRLDAVEAVISPARAAAATVTDLGADARSQHALTPPAIHPLPACQPPYFATRLIETARSRSKLALPAISAVLAASLILVAFAALLLSRLLASSTRYSTYPPYLSGIAMVSADEGWAASYNGQLWHYTNRHWGYVPDPFVDTGGGSQWFGQPGENNDLQALAPNDIWSAYGRSIYHYDGRQWRIAYTLPSDDATIIRSISMSSPNDGWAVGMNINTQGPALLRYTDGVWRQVSLVSQSTVQFWQVTTVSADEAWASGDAGADAGSGKPAPVLFHYTRGQWRQTALPTGLSFLGKPAMTGPNDGWMPAIRGDGTPAKDSGVLLRYTNGAWTVAREFGLGIWMNAIKMVSPTQGWAVGSGIWRFTNGAWTSVPLPAEVTGGELDALALVSMDEGWAGGYGVVLHLHDGAWSRYGAVPPAQPQGTPTPIPACATPAASTSAIQPGGFGASWVSLVDRWGTGRVADGGGEYLGVYADTRVSQVYVENAGVGATEVPSLVYLADPTQQLSLHDARNIAASILPRDATLYPAGDALLEQPDGAAVVYCSPALLRIQQAAFEQERKNTASLGGFAQPPTGLIYVTYVQRNDGSIDRIVFES